MAVMEDLAKRDSMSHHLAALDKHARTSSTHPDGSAKQEGETSAGEGVKGRQPVGYGTVC